MENKTSEYFYKGQENLQINNYLEAEKYFLATLNEYSQKKESKNYKFFLGAIDKISLYLYPYGHFENIELATDFYKILSPVDKNTSFGFALAIYNGIFGEPDFKKVLRLLKNTRKHFKAYMIGKMYFDGKGLDKDIVKAAFLLNEPFLQFSNWSEKANDIYYNIDVQIEMDIDSLNEEVEKILNAVLSHIQDEESLNNVAPKEILLLDFFKKTKWVLKI